MTSKLHKCLLGNKNAISWLFIGYYLLYNYVCIIFGFLFGRILVSVYILYFHDFFYECLQKIQIFTNMFVFFVVKCKFFPYNENKWIDVQNRKRKIIQILINNPV